MRWDELNRRQLSELLPEAVVVVPTGATEQHGPHLPTGTDALMATTAVERAVAGHSFPREVIVGPTVSIGSSDHHFAFGGTLSLSPETFIAVLLDIARSVSTCGGRRLVFVNGHGGNQGPCASAAAAASNRYDISIGYADYWSLLSDSVVEPAKRALVPGHAGEFETSLMLAVRPDLVAPSEPREPVTPIENPAGFQVYSDEYWSVIEGHSDDPSNASAETGKVWLDAIVDSLRDRLTELARIL
ncbi:MAG TPA: creatininase family protein [Mycobacteriales bacterium]|jgi:creatinine amidohydrolase|nr:creatininase family protein [Mycobacteriales bacterium]